MKRYGLLLIPVVFVLFYGIVYPNASILISSLQQDGHWSLANYRTVLTSPAILKSAYNSIWISVATVAGSALVGIGLAFFFHFLEFPGRRYFASLAAMPLFLPPLVGVIAFIFLYGESGVLSRLIVRVLHLHSPPWTLTGPGAILAVHIYSMYAYFYIFTANGLKSFNYSMLEAARTLGAGTFTRTFRVLLPLLSPALVSASLLTFMNSMASFSAPYLFGGATSLLTLQIYNSKVSGQWELAMAESFVLGLMSLILLLVLERERRVSGGSKGVAPVRYRPQNPLVRYAATVLGIVLSLFILLPILMLLLMSFVKDGSWTMEILPPVYTLENYAKVFHNRSLTEPVVNSLKMASLAALAAFLMALPLAYLLVRVRFTGRRLLAFLILIPSTLPGTVLGISFAASYNSTRLLNGGVILVGTFWILPIIYFIKSLPLVVRSTQAVFEQMDEQLEQASRSLGARPFYTFRRVVLPLIWPGAFSGATMAFAATLGEFVVSVLVYVPSSRPISVEIATQLRFFHLGTAAVLGVILILLTGTTLILGWKIAGLDSKVASGA